MKPPKVHQSPERTVVDGQNPAPLGIHERCKSWVPKIFKPYQLGDQIVSNEQYQPHPGFSNEEAL